MNRFVALAISCLLVELAACKPRSGGSCNTAARETCVDDKQALACHDGKWEELRCRGPLGCVAKGAEGECDQSVADDKDACNLSGNFVCTSDKKAMLECAKNRWSFVQSCLGSRGCVMDQKKVTCDNSVASAGDACREEDDHACSADQKTALVCRSGKFVLASNCKGKNGCKIGGDKNTGFKVECDDSLANVGDPCEKEGQYSCAPDERSIVKCVSKKFSQDDRCKPKEKCAVKGDLVGCY